MVSSDRRLRRLRIGAAGKVASIEGAAITGSTASVRGAEGCLRGSRFVAVTVSDFDATFRPTVCVDDSSGRFLEALAFFGGRPRRALGGINWAPYE